MRPAMKISVITVTFNSLPALRRTARSVSAQDFKDFEYIVIDGAGGDGTEDFLKEEKRIDKWLSEPDGGIYEAMNKGVRLASGDYCLFLNAGDCFAGDKVLSKVAPLLDGEDILLGNELHFDENGRLDGFTSSRNKFTVENMFRSSISHQAAFIRRALLLAHPYDESLRLVSDWKFFLERRLDPETTFRALDIDVCFFSGGGATDRFRDLGARERQDVLQAYPEYRDIWQSPYAPSFWCKVRNKTGYYIKKITYSLKEKHMA